ncbi:SDR family oxidoreductase [Spirillospora sp. CA-294931]|uniref:SDR family oxidoreductase n=1 Tax=Spirillospora sp. CA-294931 TaxID=3240042 RepID=UPI003D8C758B
MTSIIAVTGASGRIGGQVARRLADAGVAQRLVGRDPSRLPELPGAVRAPAATYGDGAAMRGAVEGADTLFLVSARESRDRVAEHITAIDAALAVGVSRVVYVSFLGAAPDATFTFGRDHWHTERRLRESGARFTFLRDSLYQADLAGMVGADGVIRGPAGEGRVGAVAHEDIADAAVSVLLGEGHDGAAYDLTGPEALTFAEIAGILGDAAGRAIEYVPETHEEALASRAGYGAAEWEVAGWVSSYEAVATGELSTVSDAVPRLTGHPALSLREYLERHPENYRHLVV